LQDKVNGHGRMLVWQYERCIATARLQGEGIVMSQFHDMKNSVTPEQEERVKAAIQFAKLEQNIK
jgi:hypothetical protein